MKNKDKKELHTKEKNELLKMAEAIRSEILKMQIDMSMAKVKNVSLVKEKKKDLARILTILGEKELEEKNSSKTKKD